jgi:hypothetical protein
LIHPCVIAARQFRDSRRPRMSGSSQFRGKPSGKADAVDLHGETSILDAADTWTWKSFRAIVGCPDVEAMCDPFVAAHREKTMKKLLLLSAFGLALLMPGGSADAQRVPPPTGPAPTLNEEQKRTQPIIQNLVTATTRYRILCFTCGGAYPNHVATGALSTGNVYEFGSGCSGPQRFIADSIPFFCSN